MSIEGNVLANSLANMASENAYQQSLTMRGDLAGQPNEVIVADVVDPLSEKIKASERTVPQVQQVSTTPGDEILNTVQKISDSHTQAIRSLSETTQSLRDKDTLSMADALKMQVGVMEFQLKNEIISKATGSISNGIQTLFRNQ